MSSAPPTTIRRAIPAAAEIESGGWTIRRQPARSYG
jgi:hypothetical protein